MVRRVVFRVVGAFAVEIHRVGEPVPGFDANKGGVLAGGLPNEPHRCGRSHAGIATSLAIEHFDGLDLPRIEDQRLVGERVDADGHERIARLVKGQGGERLQILAPRDGHARRLNATLAAGAQEVTWRPFETQESGHALPVGRPIAEIEGGMSTDLEPHGAVVRTIGHAQIGAEGAFAQSVGHFEPIGPRKLLEFLVGVLDGETNEIFALLNELPIAPAHKAVLGNLVTASVESARSVPQSAGDGEEEGRTAVPIGRISVPDDFTSVGQIYQTLDFCTSSRDFEPEGGIL